MNPATSRETGVESPEAANAGFLPNLRAIGPGLIFMLGALGARDLVANSMVGASQGTTMLWILAAAAVVRGAILEASGRYAVVNGESMLAGFGRYSRAAIYLWFGAAALSRLVRTMLKVSLMGLAAHFVLPLPTPRSAQIWSVLSCAAGFGVVFLGRYRAVEMLAKPLAAVMTCCLLVTVIASRPDFGTLVEGAFHPAFPRAEGQIPPTLVVMAVLAAATGSLSNLRYSSFVHEKGWNVPAFLHRQRLDLVIGMVGMYLILALVQVAAASTLRPLGLSVTKVEDLIPIFTLPLGETGRILFGVTLWCMVFSAMIGSSMGYAVMFSDAFHRFIRRGPHEASADLPASRRPAYRPIVLLQFVLPLIVLFTRWDPVTLVLINGVLGVVTIPLVAFLILRITASARIMGEYRNGPLSNLALVFTVMLALFLSYQLASETLNPSAAGDR